MLDVEDNPLGLDPAVRFITERLVASWPFDVVDRALAREFPDLEGERLTGAYFVARTVLNACGWRYPNKRRPPAADARGSRPTSLAILRSADVP